MRLLTSCHWHDRLKWQLPNTVGPADRTTDVGVRGSTSSRELIGRSSDRKVVRKWPKALSTVGDCNFCFEEPMMSRNFSSRRRAERQLSSADLQGARVSTFAQPRRTIHVPHIWTLTTSGSQHRWRNRIDLCVGNPRQ